MVYDGRRGGLSRGPCLWGEVSFTLVAVNRNKVKRFRNEAACGRRLTKVTLRVCEFI